MALDLSRASVNVAENRSRGHGNQHHGGRGGRGNRGGGGRGNRPVCQISTRTRHLASSCWFRFDQDCQVQASTHQAQAPQSSPLIATQETVDDPSWYVDSGATSHITSSL